MSYVKNIVKKPWGYEYLAYENDQAALWFLYIKNGHCTSMHCHPNKTTGLVVLNGEADVSFLNNTFNLKPKNKIMIRKGLFHSTKAIHEDGAMVFEIETPVNKYDLVRLRDNYGREGKPYEDSTFESPKEDDCLWIENPTTNKPNIYDVGSLRLRASKVEDISFFSTIDDNQNIIFLQGGIVAEYDINVAGAGDIVASKNVKELTKVFNKVRRDTVIMTMEKNDQQ